MVAMRFDIITIFPNLFENFSKEALISRAIKKKIINVKAHNLREWTTDKHQTVDDRPYGGGAGMVLKIEPIHKSVQFLKSKVKSQNSKLRKTFTQKDARRLSKYDQLIFICGRYEGVDERVAKYVADEEVSIGDYVLFGGEVPAMVMIEAILRLIPGAIGKQGSLDEESFNDAGKMGKEQLSKFIEYPHYTRPEIFEIKSKVKGPAHAKASVGRQRSKVLKVPKVLLSGDHKKIEEWRRKNSRGK
jgi:tRNA (guanine37-N1)-methyltransferase